MDVQSGNKRIYGAAVLAACLNGIAVGNLAGWPQAAIPQLISPWPGAGPAFLEYQASWIAGIFFLGMLAGGFIALFVAGRFGKRKLFMIAVLPLVVGWSVIAVASSFWEFMFGRVILGMGGGMICHQTEMYLSEVSPTRWRGNMSVVFVICVHLGVLLSFAVGPLMTISSATGIYLAVVLFLGAIFISVAPETPFWLVKQRRSDEALECLRKLRGKTDVYEEFDSIVDFVDRSTMTVKSDGAWTSFKWMMGNAANRKALLLVILLTTAQQFSGMAAMYSYAQLIFERTASVIPGRYVSMLIGLIELFCTIGSGFLIERVGRRPLVVASSVICAGSMAIMGLYYHMGVGDEDSTYGALPLVCVVAFALAYGLGLAAMATVVAAECLSMEVRNLGAAAQNTTVCISIFFITKLWQVISTEYGQEYSFWTAAAITAGHTIVLLIILPETRGRSLTEIQRLLAAPSSRKPVSLLPDLQRVMIVPDHDSSQLVKSEDINMN